jgi:mutator protein MutT
MRGVVAVIEEQDRLLVIRRAEGILAGGSWCFPGGGVEAGESLADALIREVWEEIGVEITPLREVWEWRRPDGGLVLSWWLARLTQPADFRPDPAEVAEVRWATPDEIRALTPVLASNLAFLAHFRPAES